MAEVLALVASGVGVAGFALQLVDCAKKPKDLVERIDDAPLHLTRLVDGVDATCQLINAVHTGAARQTLVDTELLEQCESPCQSSIESVRAVLEDLHRHMQCRRLRISIKLVWKDAKLGRDP